MAKDKKTSGAIQSHMGHISSLKKGEAKVQADHPHKLSAGEISNQQERPPKK